MNMNMSNFTHDKLIIQEEAGKVEGVKLVKAGSSGAAWLQSKHIIISVFIKQ